MLYNDTIHITKSVCFPTHKALHLLIQDTALEIYGTRIYGTKLVSNNNFAL